MGIELSPHQVKMSNKCIQYFVDPQALKNGVRVEYLDKHEVSEFEIDFEIQWRAMHWNKNNRQYSNITKA